MIARASRGPGPAARNGGSEPPASAATPRALRSLAILRIFLLPIVFAGDQLVNHPRVGTTYFNAIFIGAGVYALLALADSYRRRPRAPLWLVAALDLLFICGLTYESGGAFSQLHTAFLLLPLGAAILLDARTTAVVSGITAFAYLTVAFLHPAMQSKEVDLVVVQGLYLVWVSLAAIVLANLLARRRGRILALAAERGKLVAQALAAEERARRRLAGELHDAAIQNLLTARQDLAEARAGSHTAIERAERAIRLTVEQLRATVRELHPSVLEQIDLAAVLETIGQQEAQRGGYRIDVEVPPRCAGPHDQLIASLARELLANVTRHARATHVLLQVAERDGCLELAVRDDGCGFPPGRLTHSLRDGHIGVASCRERVHAVGGTFEIESAVGAGTSVRSRLPLERAQQVDRSMTDRPAPVGTPQ